MNALDKAVAALQRQLGGADENLVCTDIDGVNQDLSPSGYYITSGSEGLLHRIHANYPPDEIAEIGFDEVHRLRGLDPIPIEFLVDEAEHARMVRDGVLDDVEGQNVAEALAGRVEALAQGRDDN
jgi:hypothetical protein